MSGGKSSGREYYKKKIKNDLNIFGLFDIEVNGLRDKDIIETFPYGLQYVWISVDNGPFECFR